MEKHIDEFDKRSIEAIKQREKGASSYSECYSQLYDIDIGEDEARKRLKGVNIHIDKKADAYKDVSLNLKYKETFEINENGTYKSDKLIRMTEKESKDQNYLLEAHGFDSSQWEIIKAQNSIWNTYSKQDGIQELYSSKIMVKPKTSIDTKLMLEEFIENTKKYSPVQPRKIEQSSKNMFLPRLVDVHLGQLSWGEESGENYDYKIATDKCKKIVNDSITKSPYTEYEEIVLTIGDDFFNSDNMQGTTTKGTQQTNDVRPQKMFGKGCELWVWIIDAYRQAFPTTKIRTILVPGNHDTLTSFYLAKYIYAWFKNDPTVEVDISPKLHKGFAYGDTALVFTHGGRELNKLDWVYQEFRHLISSTKRTEVHSGHKHTLIVEPKDGVLIHHDPSPAPLNNWSYTDGYTNEPLAISRVYSRKGIEYQMYSRA